LLFVLHSLAARSCYSFFTAGNQLRGLPSAKSPCSTGTSDAANIGPSFVVRFCAVSPCAVLMEVRRKLRSYRGKLRSFPKAQLLSRPCGIRLWRKLRTPFLRTPLRFVFAHSAIAQFGEKCAVPSQPFLSGRIPLSLATQGLSPISRSHLGHFCAAPCAQISAQLSGEIAQLAELEVRSLGEIAQM
jgi:hypothetical protein